MSSVLNCPNCGASVRPGASRCVKCGSTIAVSQQQVTVPPPLALAPAMMAPPSPQVVYVQQPTAVTAPKSKVAAALLAFFLGCLGVHNFYMGYTGRGLAQLLLTVLTCGYGAIVTWPWAIIEFVLLLTGGINRDSKGAPLT